VNTLLFGTQMALVHDVMISFNVASAKLQTASLQQYLTALGYSVFVCLDMTPGEDFRREIARNATECKAFVIMMNDEWVKSKECRYEFNIALRKNLKNQTFPVLLPLIFSTFTWGGDYEIDGFLANVNALFLRDPLEGVWQDLVAGFERKGIVPTKLEQPKLAPPNVVAKLTDFDHPTGNGFRMFRFGTPLADISRVVYDSAVRWDELPVASEYKEEEVRYFWKPLHETTTAVQFEDLKESDYIVWLFVNEKLFRVSVRFIGSFSRIYPILQRFAANVAHIPCPGQGKSVTKKQNGAMSFEIAVKPDNEIEFTWMANNGPQSV